MANNNVTYIPNRLKNAAKGGYVTGAEDILDDQLEKSQEELNDFFDEVTHDVYRKEQVNNLISRTPQTDIIIVKVEEGQTIEQALNAATGAPVIMTPSDSKDGKYINVSGNESDIAGMRIDIYPVTAGNQYFFSGKYSGGYYGFCFLNWFDENNTFISGSFLKSVQEVVTYTQEPVIAPANAAYCYLNVQKDFSSDFAFYNSATTAKSNNLFRVPGPTNTTYSEWAWDGTEWVMLANKDYGIDDIPKEDSTNVTSSRGMYNLLPKGVEPIEGTEREGYIPASGIPQISSDYNHYVFNVEVGKKYHIHVPVFDQSSDTQVVWYITRFTSSGNYDVLPVPGGNVVANFTEPLNLVVTIPEGALALGITSRESADAPTVGYGIAINVENYVTNYVGNIVAPINRKLRLLSKNIYILDNHIISHNTPSDHPLIPYNGWDVLIIPIPNGANTFNNPTEISGTILVDVYPDDNLQLWENGSYSLGSQLDLTRYPTAKYIAFSVDRASNPNGYDNAEIQFTYDYDKSEYFILERTCITKYGNVSDTVEGINATDFLPITGKDAIKLVGGWSTSGAIRALVFYDKNKKFIEAISDEYITIQPEDIPEGARFIRATANITRPHAIYGIDNSAIIHGLNVALDKGDEVDKNTQAISEQIRTPQTGTLLPGEFRRYYDGAVIYNAVMNSFVYDNINPNNVYTAKGFGVPSSGYDHIAFVHYYHDDTWLGKDDDLFIELGPYYQTTEVKLNIPADCNKILIESNVDNTPDLYLLTYGDRINSQDLKDDIDNLKGGAGKVMKVTKSGSNLYIRTSLNTEKDIIEHFGEDGNGCIEPIETWMGDNSLSDSEIMSTPRFHFWNDSNPAVYNSTRSPWHLFGGHGYLVPCMKTVNAQLTSEDEGSKWTDQLNREYTIGKVENGYVILLPKIFLTEVRGVYTRSWDNNDSWPTLLNHVSGAVHTTQVTLDGPMASNYQIKPIQESINRRFVADGQEITKDGTYYCNEFNVSETLIGLNPLTTITWFPTPVRESEMIRLTYSYTFYGLSTRFDTTINVEYPIMAELFGGNQGQHNEAMEGYDIYVFTPRSKYVVAGHPTDVPFQNNPGASSRSTVCYRNNTDCYDKNKMPDRLVSYLQKTADGSKLIGFASGLSLTRGITKDSERVNYIPEGSLCYNNSAGQSNKMYVTAISTDGYENRLLPDTLCAVISSYFAYWDPNANTGQVYWYKDGNGYVVYAHYQEAQNKTVINLPKEMEGLSVSVVDSVGVTPLTDIVENGKIYVNAIDSNHNYIVLKIE